MEETAEIAGLRERKKAATRQALHEAAERLAAEQGFEHVTVEAIADAAGVSRRTFSNYFANKEEALFHGDAEQLHRFLELLRAAPEGDPWAVLGRAAERLLAEADGDPDPADLARRRELRRHPELVVHQAAAYTRLEADVAAELAGRLRGRDADLRARVLAACFLGAFRVATQQWVERPEGSLAATVRRALRMAAPTA